MTVARAVLEDYCMAFANMQVTELWPMGLLCLYYHGNCFLLFTFFFLGREGVGEGFTNLHKFAVLEEAVLPNASDMLLPCK